MFFTMRYASAALACCLLNALPLAAQQQVPAPQQNVPPQVPQQPAAAPAQPPTGFQLNQLQQALLDQVLDAWQLESGKINTFRCAFERWEYNVAFGPGQNIPLNKDKGELSYHKPDKGSFQITEINTFQAAQVPPGQQPPAQAQGDWVKQAEAVGEHWVCDGKSVFEYRHTQKQLVERPIPLQMQGQAIADGPLPFLFGAEAAKLKAKYWMRIDDQPNKEEIWLSALPKYQAQAADFSKVEVILDRQRLLPKAMQIHLPNGSRHLYMFDIANAVVNGRLAAIQALFSRPRKPYGWQHVVEQIPVAQVPQPGEQPR